jgi:hypothetical protein
MVAIPTQTVKIAITNTLNLNPQQAARIATQNTLKLSPTKMKEPAWLSEEMR